VTATSSPLSAARAAHHRVCSARILSAQIAGHGFYPDSPIFHRKSQEDPQKVRRGMVLKLRIHDIGHPNAR
jgi:hypothetical protein